LEIGALHHPLVQSETAISSTVGAATNGYATTMANAVLTVPMAGMSGTAAQM
jgi:hypothetical protein